MKTTLEDLKKRRSCRVYKAEQITDTELEEVLEAGIYAPTGMGNQSPVIVAVQNKAVISLMSKLNAAVMGADIDPFYGAPTVLVVLAPKNAMTYLQDGCLVMGNLLNAAGALGLGSCWVHRAKEVFETPEGKDLLKQWGLDETYEGIGNCILGYRADELPDAAPRKNDYIIRVK